MIPAWKGKNVWSTSRTEPSTMPTRASPTSHALSVTSCIMWESHLILFLLPLGAFFMPSRTAWWENSKGFWIRDAMNRHEEGKRKSNEVILPAVWAHIVHLDEDFISPECISLTLCASVNFAQVHGSPKHIASLSGFGQEPAEAWLGVWFMEEGGEGERKAFLLAMGLFTLLSYSNCGWTPLRKPAAWSPSLPTSWTRAFGSHTQSHTWVSRLLDASLSSLLVQNHVQ